MKNSEQIIDAKGVPIDQDVEALVDRLVELNLEFDREIVEAIVLAFRDAVPTNSDGILARRTRRWRNQAPS